MNIDIENLDIAKVQFFSDEYLEWLINRYDNNGKSIPFNGVRYCTFDKKCSCRTCRQFYQKQWPYNRVLSATLLHLSGVNIHEINHDEVEKFENCIINDYYNDMDGFYDYVVDLCSSNSDYGLYILNLFVNSTFDKPTIHKINSSSSDSKIDDVLRLFHIAESYQRKLIILRELFI